MTILHKHSFPVKLYALYKAPAILLTNMIMNIQQCISMIWQAFWTALSILQQQLPLCESQRILELKVWLLKSKFNILIDAFFSFPSATNSILINVSFQVPWANSDSAQLLSRQIKFDISVCQTAFQTQTLSLTVSAFWVWTRFKSTS